MSNRKQLETRARRYGNARWHHSDGSRSQLAANGFADGYKAAMKDLRKRIRNAGRDTAHIKDPFKRARVRHGFIAAEVSQFLRPLR